LILALLLPYYAEVAVIMTLYAAHVLPQRGEHLSLCADKYSELRLTALRQSPEAFSGTIGDEMEMTPQQRLARMLQPQRRVVIVAVQSGKQDWLQEDWAGSVTLLGPRDKQEYFAPFNLHQSTKDTPKDFTFDSDDGTAELVAKRKVNAFYHMTALFVDKNHRRRGIAKMLCDRSFQVAVEQSRQADMRIFIAPTNFAVFDMYKQLGFKTAHEKCTLAEALVASNDPLPAAYDTDSKYNTRGGIIMIRHLG
jgi:ribosomal protein S18 acetylase RimI-like enzyme